MTNEPLPQWEVTPAFWDMLRMLLEAPEHMDTHVLWQSEMWQEPDLFYEWIGTNPHGQAMLDGQGLQAWRRAMMLVRWSREDQEQLAAWVQRLASRPTHGNALRLRRLRTLGIVPTPEVHGDDEALIGTLKQWVRAYNQQNAARYTAAKLHRLAATGDRTLPPEPLLAQLEPALKQALVTYGSGIDHETPWPEMHLRPIQPEHLAFIARGVKNEEERQELKMDLQGAMTAPENGMYTLVSETPFTCCGSETIILVMPAGIWCLQCYMWC